MHYRHANTTRQLSPCLEPRLRCIQLHSPCPPYATSALPLLFTIFRSHIFTFQHVPKGARDLWAKALSDCLSSSSVTNNPNDLVLWTKLFMLPNCVLVSPAAGHRLPWRDILRQVKSRLHRWATGDYTALCSEAQTEGRALSRQARAPPTSPNAQRNHNVRRVRRAVVQQGNSNSFL